MSKMHVNHSLVVMDLEKFYSVAAQRAKQQKIKLVEDIGSEYCVELKALQKIEYLKIFIRGYPVICSF